MIVLPDGENRMIVSFVHLDKTPECDGGRTDGQKDGSDRGIYSARCKKWKHRFKILTSNNGMYKAYSCMQTVPPHAYYLSPWPDCYSTARYDSGQVVHTFVDKSFAIADLWVWSSTSYLRQNSAIRTNVNWKHFCMEANWSRPGSDHGALWLLICALK